jgi:hypothetical protein
MRVIAFVFLWSTTVLAQTGVTVDLDEVVDNRVSAGPFVGSLELRVNLKGSGLEKATAARIVVKEARDDRGTVLYDGPMSPPDFTPRDYNSGTLQVSVKQPARAASSVRIKGSVELFVPSRDPSAVVKIDKALAKLDTPLSSKTLKDAKLVITPLSRPAYAELMKSRKLDEKQIEALRAEGKARGVPEKEIELAIEMAKAFESIDAEPTEGAVILSGKKSDFDRIFRVEILGTDGKPINVGSRSTSSRGESSVMMLHPSEAPPDGAALQLFVLTQKSRVSFPFDLNVRLP